MFINANFLRTSIYFIACFWSTEAAKNPYENGCLATMAERNGEINRFSGKRVCNTDDDRAGNYDSCRAPTFDSYFEVRIGSSNWDESIMLGWIYQILLSEVLGVPTTIEGGREEKDSSFSFYDTEGRFEYPAKTYEVDGLVEANLQDGDCTKTNKTCAHIIPTVWAGGKQDTQKFQDLGHILPQEQRNGVSGTIAIYIPLVTAQRDPSLVSYLGLQGEANRKKLAAAFRTPTNWTVYCSLDDSHCVTGDNVASRAPTTEEEGGKYFVDGLYDGHFRIEDSNDCTKNADCTGHVVAPRCDWTNYIEAQMYWNNVSLASKGNLSPNRGYEYGEMLEIYNAANATGSDVFIWWWSPEILIEVFEGSDYELYKVAFPQATRECLTYRRSGKINRCSENLAERLGSDPIGSCDYEQESPTKVISRGFLTATEAKPDAIQSPAYELMKNVGLPLFPIRSMLQDWHDLRRDKNVSDPEREGVCKWMYENVEYLLDYVPRGYPRTIEVIKYETLTSVGIVLGIVTLLVVMVSFGLLVKWRNKREIRYAQVDALLMTTIGYAFLAMVAITNAFEPSDISCVLSQWFTRIGYTMAMVPILVKISAVNKLTRAGLRFQRAEIDHAFLRRVLAMTTLAVLIYLTLWTVFDTFRQETIYILGLNDDNNTNLVHAHNACESKSPVWQTAAFGFEAIILIAITILTYQSRDVIEELNESQLLAFMVYSHFLFLVMRLLVFMLMLSGLIPNALCRRIISLLVSSDTLAAIFIYFGPKFIKVIKNPDSSNESRGIHIKPTLSSGESSRRNIAGIKTPIGGVPNLIKKRTDSSDQLPVDRRIALSTQLSSKKIEDQQSKVTFSQSVKKSTFRNKDGRRSSANSLSSGSEEELNYTELLSSIRKPCPDFPPITNLQTNTPLAHDETENRGGKLNTLIGENKSLKEKNMKLESLLSRYSKLMHSDEALDFETASLIEKEQN